MKLTDSLILIVYYILLFSIFIALFFLYNYYGSVIVLQYHYLESNKMVIFKIESGKNVLGFFDAIGRIRR